MQPKQLLKQMVDFNKSALDNSFNTMLILQEQTERMAKTYTDLATGISAETKSAIDEWTKPYKKGLADFKSTMDENFEKVESFLSPKK